MKYQTKLNLHPRSAPAKTWFNQGWLSLYFLLPEEEFENLQLWLDDSASFVVGKQKAFDEDVDIAAEKFDAEQRSYYYDIKSEEYERLHGKLPNIVSNSILLMACSLFESTLTDLCKHLDRNAAPRRGASARATTGNKGISIKESWEATKGTGIRKAARFLRTNFDIQADRYPPWTDIAGHYDIRHCCTCKW
jgi:hypothetical protein